MTLRFPVAPMKASIGTLPPDDGSWAYEIKWDGYRTLAFVDGGRTRWQSSNLIDVTAKYPELGEFAETPSTPSRRSSTASSSCSTTTAGRASR